MTELAYSKQNVRQLDELPASKQTEDLGVDIPNEVYDGLHYGEFPVVDMGWWFTHFYIWYDNTPSRGPYWDEFEEGDDLPMKFDDIRWRSWAEEDGTIVVNTESAAGILDHETVEQSHSPGAEALYDVYEAMREAGVKLVTESEHE